MAATKLTAADAVLAAQAWMELLRAAVLLRTPWRGRLFRDHAMSNAGGRGDANRIQHLLNLAGAHHLKPMNCLERSIALRQLLLRHGIAAELRIGVRKHGDQLEGHAWVEAAALAPDPLSADFRVLQACQTPPKGQCWV